MPSASTAPHYILTSAVSGSRRSTVRARHSATSSSAYQHGRGQGHAAVKVCASHAQAPDVSRRLSTARASPKLHARRRMHGGRTHARTSYTHCCCQSLSLRLCHSSLEPCPPDFPPSSSRRRLILASPAKYHRPTQPTWSESLAAACWISLVRSRC